MAYRILLRRDTLINWNYNEPVLLSGEAGFVTDTGRLKIGDGQSNWSALPYLNTGLSEVNLDILPALDRTYNIGSDTLRWKDGYFSTVYTDSATIYIGTAQISQAPNDGIQASAYTIADPNGGTGVQLVFDNGTIAVIDSNGGTGEFGTRGATGPQGVTGPQGSSGIISTTYSELTDQITDETLSPGTFYIITNFRTCYDQPDFNYDNVPITTGNYKESDIEPIVVLATSASTISSTAYQPSYPNDRIQYDWTFSETEVTNGVAYGRITERIDEFDNRTDYDHRTILFKRYRLYTYRQDQRLNGTIELSESGAVSGTNTSFELLSVGDVIYVPIDGPGYYEITEITDDFTMVVSGDTIPNGGSGLSFYKAIEESNDGDGGYFSYKRTNVKTNDFIEYTTFGDAISENFAKNNYVGNYSNNYTNLDLTFILANNVFLQGAYESNKYGDSCYNNTFGTDNQNNIWGNHCYQNVSTNDIDDNIIGHYFYNNLINANLIDNHIGNDFNNNQLLAENNESFEDNIIGNGFNSNVIYSYFYKNEILDNFNNNTIGNSVDLDNFEFYRNYIRNNFNNNTIRQEFQNNQIGTNFQNNKINGEFQGNTILNGYNNNTTGNYFNLNNIGNAFNNNTVYDDFYYNTTDYYFYNNVISSNFYSNNIGTGFEDNQPSNSNLFGWNNLSTVSTRTYDTLRDSLNNNVGNHIMGKQLVMRVISTSQYFKIKFTQWTQGGNGGGFQYERQELGSNGNTMGNSITFTKTNNGSEVDVIVEGVVELTRDSQGGLYNTITDTPPFNNQWPGPGDTEWNSIYTQLNNGENFRYNTIGNDFINNTIGSFFGYYSDDVDSSEKGNKIGDKFSNNTVISTMYGNVIGNDFQNNTIANPFRNNQIGNGFHENTIGDIEDPDEWNFQDNVFGNEHKGNLFLQDFSDNTFKNYSAANEFIGNTYGNTFSSLIVNNTMGQDFNQNIIGESMFENVIGENFENNRIGNGLHNNIIGNYFAYNVIGHRFQANTIADDFGFGGNNQRGNLIGNNFIGNNIGEYFYDNSIIDNFEDNIIGNYFQFNDVKTGIFDINFTQFLGNITGVTYDALSATDGTYTGITQTATSGGGTGAVFTVTVSGSIVSNVLFTTPGINYEVGNTVTIRGEDYQGENPLILTVNSISPVPSVYEYYNTTIFKRKEGQDRLSYFDENDILTINDINQ